jgi:hypothetical protein
MKKTITILSITLFALLSALEAEASRLYLQTRSINASVFIDGQNHFSSNGDFRINNIRPGNHRIVMRERRNNRGHNRGGVIYSGRINVPQQSVVFARITPRGRLIIDEVGRIQHSRAVNPPYRGNRNWETHPRNRTRQPQQDFNRRGNVYNRGANFNAALRTIEGATFESTRMDIAKQYIRTNAVSSRQVLQIMETMKFESSRLEIAKFAYRFTWDKQNYFLVHQGFRFSSSSRTLNRFLR